MKKRNYVFFKSCGNYSAEWLLKCAETELKQAALKQSKDAKLKNKLKVMKQVLSFAKMLLKYQNSS